MWHPQMNILVFSWSIICLNKVWLWFASVCRYILNTNNRRKTAVIHAMRTASFILYHILGIFNYHLSLSSCFKDFSALTIGYRGWQTSESHSTTNMWWCGCQITLTYQEAAEKTYASQTEPKLRTKSTLERQQPAWCSFQSSRYPFGINRRIFHYNTCSKTKRAIIKHSKRMKRWK